eukprot:693452-Pelagomonas_calceolata.AAC.1
MADLDLTAGHNSLKKALGTYGASGQCPPRTGIAQRMAFPNLTAWHNSLKKALGTCGALSL